MTEPVCSTHSLDRRAILLCVDGSPHSKMAMSLLQHLLRPEDIVHVYCSFVRDSFLVPDSDLRAKLQAFVDHIKESLMERLAGRNVITAVEVTTDVRQSILDYASEHGIWSIFMGSRGLSRLQRIFVGSVSSHIMHHVDDKAVVAVHKFEGTETGVTLLLCVDGSEHSKRATQWVGSMSGPRDQVIILSTTHQARAVVMGPSPDVLMFADLDIVSTQPNPNFVAEQKALLAKAESYAADAQATLISQGIAEERCSLHVTVCDDVRETILTLAHSRGVAMIVLGSRGLGPVRRAMGSVSDYIFNNAVDYAVAIVR